MFNITVNHDSPTVVDVNYLGDILYLTINRLCSNCLRLGFDTNKD